MHVEAQCMCIGDFTFLGNYLSGWVSFIVTKHMPGKVLALLRVHESDPAAHVHSRLSYSPH